MDHRPATKEWGSSGSAGRDHGTNPIQSQASAAVEVLWSVHGFGQWRLVGLKRGIFTIEKGTI